MVCFRLTLSPQWTCLNYVFLWYYEFQKSTKIVFNNTTTLSVSKFTAGLDGIKNKNGAKNVITW